MVVHVAPAAVQLASSVLDVSEQDILCMFTPQKKRGDDGSFGDDHPSNDLTRCCFQMFP